MTVCAVVPAYNEAERILAVVEVLIAAPSVSRILVVDDGSTDGTAETIERHAAFTTPALDLLRQCPNQGKGAAMWAGGQAAQDADILLFLDADLIGLTVDHVERLLAPVRSGKSVMALGVFRGGNFWTTLAQVLVPNISGQRAIRRALFLSIPGIAQARYGVELAITNHVLGEGLPTAQVILSDVSHPPKERKLGLLRGVASRLTMYRQMLPFMLRRYAPKKGNRK